MQTETNSIENHAKLSSWGVRRLTLSFNPSGDQTVQHCGRVSSTENRQFQTCKDALALACRQRFPKQVRRGEMTERWNAKIWNDWSARGDAVIYLATPDDHEGYVGEYSIDWRGEVSRKELRAYRESRKRKGLPVSAQSRQQLQYGLFVIFGAGTSPIDAVASLRSLANQIEKKGLLVGKRSNGDYVVETCEGDIRP